MVDFFTRAVEVFKVSYCAVFFFLPLLYIYLDGNGPLSGGLLTNMI